MPEPRPTQAPHVQAAIARGAQAGAIQPKGAPKGLVPHVQAATALTTRSHSVQRSPVQHPNRAPARLPPPPPNPTHPRAAIQAKLFTEGRFNEKTGNPKFQEALGEFLKAEKSAGGRIEPYKTSEQEHVVIDTNEKYIPSGDAGYTRLILVDNSGKTFDFQKDLLEGSKYIQSVKEFYVNIDIKRDLDNGPFITHTLAHEWAVHGVFFGEAAKRVLGSNNGEMIRTTLRRLMNDGTIDGLIQHQKLARGELDYYNAIVDQMIISANQKGLTGLAKQIAEHRLIERKVHADKYLTENILQEQKRQEFIRQLEFLFFVGSFLNLTPQQIMQEILRRARQV